MTRNIKTRIEALERSVVDKKFIPALIYSSTCTPTREEALQEYKKLHGFDFPSGGHEIVFRTIDCTPEGGGKEVDKTH